ncbi:transposase [Microdochium trichocladiopsis]|uniref:Transposase n=1 Tax=Microdochium trichocladiopsis TaxID=1682393 RepID=A0A9P9BUA9_9PEZI|nr:transposase [Microdochium trichocladiopsis]KAH7037436.1 transposase [Microdochium trichocladiopsis]
MGKLYAIADLHLSYASNREALSALHEGVHHDDGLILAGDMGEKLEHLHAAFRWATAHFMTVWWVPGNHELYTIPSESGNSSSSSSSSSSQARGVDKYDLCVSVARSYGVKTPEDEFEVWPGGEFADGRDRAVVCPIFTLYDYSFRPDGVERADALAWALEEDIQATDEVLLHPDPFATRDEWCAALVDRFEAKLQRACDRHPDLPLVVVNHWPLTEKVVYLPRIPRFSLWCGTRKTADWHTRFRAKVVVSGHLHIRRTDWIDGVRFEECSLGYPRQWEPLAKEVGRDINAFLREILPGRGNDPGDGKPIWRTYG